ncbi:MAG: restriction endonuclease subunit S [Rhodanobacter lindaniclasticus]
MIFRPEQQRGRLKWYFESCKNGAWGEEPDGEHDVMCIRAADFDGISGRLKNGERTVRAIDRRVFAKVALRSGDLVVEKSGGGDKQLVGRSVLFEEDNASVCSNFLARARPVAQAHPAYLNYLLLALYNARGTYPYIKQSTGIQNLDMAGYLDTRVDVPSLDTQRRVADFLDEKTARIDALIAKKHALLERLAEKRQALITQAVTKGLDPSAPMKDSGIGWLGRVSAHWRVVPVKRVAKLESGHTPDKKVDAYWEDCKIPWVSLNDTDALRNNDYISDTAYRINEQGLANSSARLLPARAVVFTRDATIGESAITLCPMAVSQHIIAWLCDEALVLPEFLLFAIYGMTGELLRLTNGSTIGTIGLGDVKSIHIALPPIEEQRAIVSFVSDSKDRIAVALNKVRASVDRLTEYRAALITAAVTGQLPALNG